jgi:hypothetical protein
MDKGIWCLQKLRVVANPGGASQGVRAFLKSGLIDYAKTHSHLKIDVIHSSDLVSHPKLIGFYNDGSQKSISLRNKTPNEVKSFCDTLRQRKGRDLAKNRWAAAQTAKPSFQGVWSPEVTQTYPLLAPRFVAAKQRAALAKK